MDSDHRHKQQQQRKTHLMNRIFHFIIHRPAFYFFHDEKECAAAIKSWEWQDV